MTFTWARINGLARHAITRTAGFNMVMVLATTVTGILTARALGEAGRGYYAAISAWYLVALVVGEFGQSVAVTYAVSRNPSRLSEILSSSRILVLPLGILLTVGGMIAAPWLSSGNAEVTAAYRIAFLGCAINTVFGPFLYALQATSIAAWNRVRILAPITYVSVATGFFITGHLTLITACVALVVAELVQMATAGFVVVVRVGAWRRKPSRPVTRQLSSMGFRQSASAIPESVATNIDRIALSTWSGPIVLGNYAVATSVVGAALPLSMAISSVAFPRMAADRGDARTRAATERRMLLATTVVSTVSVALLAISAGRLVPFLFGPEFDSAVAMVWYLVPAAVFRALTLVASALLRGRGLVGRASTAQLAGLAVAGSAVLLLVPGFNAVGAAMALALGQATALAITLLYLVRAARSSSGAPPEHSARSSDATDVPADTRKS